MKTQGKIGAMIQGQSDIDQMVQISNYLGTPNPKNWPNITEMPDYGKIIFKEVEPVKNYFKIEHPLVEILGQMLRYESRITSDQLFSQYFI